MLRLTIGPQFHQEIAGGPLQSSALQSPDRVQDSEEQNYEEVHLQSEISLQYPDENVNFFHQEIAGGPPQSSALHSPDRVQDSEEQNYEEVHLQFQIWIQ